MNTAQSKRPAATSSGKSFLKWGARVAGAVATAIVYIKWKEVTESYDLENGVMGTYRPVALGLAYYLLWIFTRKIDGSSYKDTERRGDDPQRLSGVYIASFLLFVCVAMAAGFLTAQFVYVEAINRSADVIVATTLGFVAYLVAAGVVLGVLSKMVDSLKTDL